MVVEAFAVALADWAAFFAAALTLLVSAPFNARARRSALSFSICLRSCSSFDAGALSVIFLSPLVSESTSEDCSEATLPVAGGRGAELVLPAGELGAVAAAVRAAFTGARTFFVPTCALGGGIGGGFMLPFMLPFTLTLPLDTPGTEGIGGRSFPASLFVILDALPALNRRLKRLCCGAATSRDGKMSMVSRLLALLSLRLILLELSSL